ncbi:MAG TPA: 3-hydroxyacyl-ACP dehydratase FabZ family protein [Xanthobacteraceae bacterium]|jgi:3-hydroxyacyl-[acyl-carrier-protein] dehydratase|nr:3-hydroxyacyl-ACP dehydratase FabZ family protein [Xanthobacteraceae bacterium]
MRIEYFQLIDRIAEIDVDARRIRAIATVPQTSTIFEGHFPGHPLMPGVLLIETMAQTSGWLVIGLTRFERMPFLAAVKEAKFRRFVTPGEVLSVEAELVHDGSGFAVTHARIVANGEKPVCEAEIRLRVMPFPNPDFRSGMLDYARRLQFPLGATADG